MWTSFKYNADGIGRFYLISDIELLGLLFDGITSIYTVDASTL